MKKILTLLFAVVTVSAFAAHQGPVKMQKLQQQHAKATVEKAQMGEKATAVKGLKGITDPIDTLYNHPYGSFFVAPYRTATGGLSGYSAMLVPGGVELTWPNLTTGYTGTYTWWWFDEDLDPEYYSEATTDDLVTNWRNDGYGFWYAPRLFVGTVETGDETFYRQDAGVQYGGKMELDPLGDQSVLTNMYQYYFWDDNRDNLWLGATGAGTNSEEINFWEEWIPAMQEYGEIDAAVDYAKLTKYVQIFGYPGRPYAFSRIELVGAAEAQAGDKLTAKVCRVVDNTIQNDSPIAEAEYVFETATTADASMNIVFNFETFDEEVGLTVEDWITIDSEMCIVIEGADKLGQFYLFCCGVEREHYRLHPELADGRAYCEWEFYSNNELYDVAYWDAGAGYYWGSQEDNIYYLPDNFMLGINAQFAFIEDDETAAVEETIPAEGGTYTFNVRASEPYDAWTAESMPEGVEVNAEDQFDNDGVYTCKTTLTVTVAPNTNGEVVYTLPGTEFKIIVGNGGGSVAVPGDVNGDGTVTAADVTMLYNILLNDDWTGVVNGDQNGDGSITAADVTAVYNILLGSE